MTALPSRAGINWLILRPSWNVACGLRSCGGPPPTGEVYGKVTTPAGKPVTAGVVKFFPESGGEPVLTSLLPDGTYRATGIPLGRAKVAIETQKTKIK